MVHHLQQERIDEAAWLVFLMVYLAKPEEGWTRLRDTYGRLGAGRWDWAAVSADPHGFEQWLAANWTKIRGKFGNHRKYRASTLRRPVPLAPPSSSTWNGLTLAAVTFPHFATIVRNAGNDPHVIFDTFYAALPIKGFGRLGRFDWVAMLARYGLIPAEAGSAYLKGATGPGRGARLLFQGDPQGACSNDQLQAWLDLLDRRLGVGMEVMRTRSATGRSSRTGSSTSKVDDRLLDFFPGPMAAEEVHPVARHTAEMLELA